MPQNFSWTCSAWIHKALKSKSNDTRLDGKLHASGVDRARIPAKFSRTPIPGIEGLVYRISISNIGTICIVLRVSVRDAISASSRHRNPLYTDCSNRIYAAGRATGVAQMERTRCYASIDRWTAKWPKGFAHILNCLHYRKGDGWHSSAFTQRLVRDTINQVTCRFFFHRDPTAQQMDFERHGIKVS